MRLSDDDEEEEALGADECYGIPNPVTGFETASGGQIPTSEQTNCHVAPSTVSIERSGYTAGLPEQGIQLRFKSERLTLLTL
jgi:hypothetical protein